MDIIDAFPGEMTPDLEGPIIEPSASEKLMLLANKAGDFSEAIDINALARIGQEVCEDYERDKFDRKDWAEIASEALKLAAQEHKGEVGTYPWKGCSNVRYPLLTTAALQFNARAYPAIVKGDEAVSVKVVGQDRGRPAMQMTPQGPMPVMVPVAGPDGNILAGPDGQPVMEPQWLVPPGGKASRAARVAEYMNTVLFYRMYDWEADTDVLLIQLPVVGCVFRKIWFDHQTREQKSAMVPALRILVPEGARSCDTTPRLTEEIPDVYPYQIRERQRSGFYRDIILEAEDETVRAGGRLLLESHRMMDLDEDGLDEPYIVTVDHTTQRVLRIEANFAPEDVKTGEDGRVLSIRRGKFYVKYDFFPHPEGKFYGLGLGHLLAQLGDVIDTAINQLIDAGTAQTAGGGFIASGVRLQGKGAVVRFQPGEYKTVSVDGGNLRNAIVERTLPAVSPVTFQVLDLILGAARDISGAKDVITGDASNMGQVGTTLALIEQGLQVFNAVYKRVYRALKEEFTMIYRNLARFGGEEAREDYIAVMDDPAANFEADFNASDMDIRPVSDPSSVTRMQKMARAQFLMGTVQMPGTNPVAILRRVYEAADVENPDELFIEPQPDPKSLAEAEKITADAEAKQAGAMRDLADMEKKQAETVGQKIENQAKAFGAGAAMGAMSAAA